MADLLPLDLTGVFEAKLMQTREPSGELYCSAHLTGSLRHAMLDVVGAPKAPRSLMDEITMATGDLWHDWMYKQIDRLGWPYMREVKLSPWLPEGWRGRADLLLYHPEYKAFVLGDIKTTKGESMFWLERMGAKESHIWQGSAYWHAAVNMGLPMLEALFILYWPKSDVKGQDIAPQIIEVEPLPLDVVRDTMQERWEATKAYLSAVEAEDGEILVPELAEPQERLQKVQWDGTQNNFKLSLVPHWSTKFCDYPDLCDCSEQKPEKIGAYGLDGVYVPRKGYEERVPEARPSDVELSKRNRMAQVSAGKEVDAEKS